MNNMAIVRSSFKSKKTYFNHLTKLSIISALVCTLTSASLDLLVEDDVVETLTSKIESNADDHLMDLSLKFHVGLCRKICNGTQKLVVMESELTPCPSLCANCDCNVTCPFYGTCCPKVDVKTPVLEEDIHHKIYSEYKESRYFIGNMSDYRLVDGNDDFTIIQSDPGLKHGLRFKDRFQCFKTSWPNHYGRVQYFMISNCSPSESNETLRHLCETTKYDIDVFSSDFFTPVTDIRNGVVFKNLHCARCNYHDENHRHHGSGFENGLDNDEESNLHWQEHITIWNIRIMCSSYQDLYKINSEEEFLKAVFIRANRNIFRSPDEYCDIHFEPPLPITILPRQCKSSDVPEYGVLQVGVPRDVLPPRKSNKTECSVRHGPGSNLYELCQTLTARAYRYDEENNVFCYLCNDRFSKCISSQYDDRIQVVYVDSPLAFLLGSKSGASYFSGDTKTVLYKEGYLCMEPMRWMDEEGICQLPTCTEGKSLDVDSGTCTTVVSRINSLRYKFFMLLETDWRIPANYTTNYVYTILKEYFFFTNGASLNIHCVIYNYSQENDYIKFVKIDGSFRAHPNYSRGELEKMVLFPKSDLNANETWFAFFNESKIIFGHETTEAILKARYHQVYDLDFSYKILGDMDGPMFSPSDPLVSVEAGYKEIITHRIDVDNDDYVIKYGYLFGGKTDFIDINPSLVCPFVEMNLTNITADSFQQIQIGFYYNGSENVFNASRFENKYSILNRKLRICIDTFRTEFQTFTYSLPRNETGDEISATKKAIRYLTLICLGVSVVSLVLTIITYALFESLRTQPGVNTLTLSICLTLAQLFLILVTILVGHIEGWFCQVIGVVLHYSWLAAFHWMNANCIYTFIVFNKIKARTTGDNFRKSFLKYSIYAFGMSMIYIALHVILSEVLSKGTSFGYSSELCLFDLASSNIPPIASFVIPLGIMVFINGVLFSITVKRIMTLRKEQETVRSRKSRQEFLTYVKLSSLTGLFWLLTILAVHFDNDVLNIINIPFVALQGLFIFLSFVANGKVKHLYLVLLGYEREPGSSSAATANTYIKTSKA